MRVGRDDELATSLSTIPLDAKNGFGVPLSNTFSLGPVC
jgi:hypothetical protein